jgi:hypothetical protein
MLIFCPRCRCVAKLGRLVGKHLGKAVYKCAVCGTLLLSGIAGVDDQPHGAHRERNAPPPIQVTIVSTAAATSSSSGPVSWYVPPWSSA